MIQNLWFVLAAHSRVPRVLHQTGVRALWLQESSATAPDRRDTA